MPAIKSVLKRLRVDRAFARIVEEGRKFITVHSGALEPFRYALQTQDVYVRKNLSQSHAG